MNKARIALWGILAASGIACVAASYHVRHEAERRFFTEAAREREQARRIEEQVVRFTERVVPAHLPFTAALEGFGIDSLTAGQIAASAESVFNLRHVRAGNQLAVGRSVLGELRAIRYRIDVDRVLLISHQGNEFHSEIDTVPSETKVAGVTGEIRDSLFEAVVNAGERPELAMRLADIFGWDLDFYTDPRPGDTFRVVVEKKVFAHETETSYGRILAAEYDNGGHIHRAVLFHDPSGKAAYYSPDGKSMKKVFLHSPLKFAAPITSHFSLHRFHPILKEYRPHLGIDYAAPTGTPVQSIGDGRVIFAGWKGESGNLIEIQHSNGYTTYYMHLSRILVRDGERVEQGQGIGLVGMTGLATGPHLDFRIQRHGQFLNFERLPLPPSEPVAQRDWDEFAAVRDQMLAEMPSLPNAQQAVAAKTTSPTSPQGHGQ